MPILRDLSIVDTWKRLGGGNLQGRPPRVRARAFWRDGDGWSISINADKSTFFDFVAGEGGGVLRLVEVALGSDQAEALAWLSQNCGLEDRHQTPAERACARRQQWAAERFEQQLQPSYRACLGELEARRQELIERLRVADDPDAELELRFVYDRIDHIRRAIGDDVDPTAAAVTAAIVRLLEWAERNQDESTEGA